MVSVGSDLFNNIRPHGRRGDEREGGEAAEGSHRGDEREGGEAAEGRHPGPQFSGAKEVGPRGSGKATMAEFPSKFPAVSAADNDRPLERQEPSKFPSEFQAASAADNKARSTG